jgi:hypothetical protein
LDRIYYPLLAISIAFLGFVGGALVVFTKVFPYSYLNNVYQGITALYQQATRWETPYQTSLWRRARTEQRGVTINKPDKTHAGFTLYSSHHAPKAFLISMDGTVMHEWGLPLREIWDNPDRKLRPEGYITWDFVYMYPNGDLIVIYVGFGDTPWGYGLVKMDKNSKVIWKYFDSVHHDLDIAEDGKIYALTNSIRTHRIKGYEHLEPPRIDDYVVVLSPDGKPIRRVSIMDSMVQSRYGRMMRTLSFWDTKQDFLHTNSIEVIDDAAASRLPFASEGQVLLSLRNINAIAILDLDLEEIVWALRGPWHRQHDADMLPDGNILLFDNGGHYEPGGGSRVIEFNPSPLAMVWAYTGDREHLLDSRIRSGQQRLRNDNTLITESDGGRLIEVTPGGEVVWEYINPVRGGEADELIPVLSEATRLDPAWLETAFLKMINDSKQAAHASAAN